jgi:hypothetical protein
MVVSFMIAVPLPWRRPLDFIDADAGEDRVEGCGECRVGVAQQPPSSVLVVVDQQVPGLLGYPGADPEDLVFVIWSHSRITQATRTVAPDVWRRHLYPMLDAFRPEHAHPLPEPPRSPRQAYDAMTTLGGTTGSRPL